MKTIIHNKGLIEQDHFLVILEVRIQNDQVDIFGLKRPKKTQNHTNIYLFVGEFCRVHADNNQPICNRH